MAASIRRLKVDDLVGETATKCGQARETDTGTHLRPRDDLASAVLDAFVGAGQPGIRSHHQAVWRGNGAGAGNPSSAKAPEDRRARMSVGSGDFKSFACRGLERDYRHTSCKRRNLDGVREGAVLSLIDDG